ncbi:MAG: glycosyltransferase [Candidatus Omnitrophica bacterium]|nr:glycosyltransferase [Candidatus Omnitrophota bacterium]MBU1997329.1 glycosyltransferase [Candidatus Omnitrophota bacterium]MBU4333822.1 glycosyltransferase [Candidatus Omnitrophota bacterium]
MPNSNHSDPKVSIILPSYNGSKFIKRSIDSCLRQSYCNIELIIIDDGSTDNTLEISRTFRDKRMGIISTGRNLGIVESLNIGFNFASGDYLTWTSDDNYYSLDAIKIMANILNKTRSVDFVYSNYSVIDENGDFIKKGKVKKPALLDIDNYIGGCFLYRRSVYEKVGKFNKDAFLVEDYEYWLRIRKNFNMKMLNDNLYTYTMHSGSITAKHKTEAIQQQVERVREGYMCLWRKEYFLGRKHYYDRNYKEAKKSLIKSLLKYPFNIQAIRLLLLIYLNPRIVSNIRMLKNRVKKN